MARHVAACFGFLICVAAALAGSDSGHATEPEPASAAQLDCGSIDVPVLDAIVEVGTDVPGNERSPKESIRRFAQMYPEMRGLPLEAFRRSNSATDRVTFVLDREAARRGIAVTERIGDSWYLTYIAVCSQEVS